LTGGYQVTDEKEKEPDTRGFRKIIRNARGFSRWN
jgi:hypothetical protein